MEYEDGYWESGEWEPMEIEETADPNYVAPVSETEATEVTEATVLTEATEATEVTQESEAGTEATIYAELPGAESESTIQVVTVEVLETGVSTITHATLFGSFLVCGTLIGLFLLRGCHGRR